MDDSGSTPYSALLVEDGGLRSGGSRWDASVVFGRYVKRNRQVQLERTAFNLIYQSCSINR
jgi:hypothetical protein